MKKFLYATLFDTPTDVSRQRRSSIKLQRKAKKHKKRASKKKKRESYPVRRLKVKIPVEDTDYVMEYSLLFDKIFEVSRNRFDLNKNPRIEVAANKTQDLRDEFSSYCGQKKTIKNWLFYVWTVQRPTTRWICKIFNKYCWFIFCTIATSVWQPVQCIKL